LGLECENGAEADEATEEEEEEEAEAVEESGTEIGGREVALDSTDEGGAAALGDIKVAKEKGVGSRPVMGTGGAGSEAGLGCLAWYSDAILLLMELEPSAACAANAALASASASSASSPGSSS
jgi:hypothetical protein